MRSESVKERILVFFKWLLVFSLAAPGTYAANAPGAETTRSNSDHSTELWQGSVLTATFRAGMCFGRDGNARGVLILRHKNGKEDTYHLYGRLEGNEFNLSHSSGHHFSGEITGANTIKGSVKLSNGLRLGLSGDRKVNVPLAAEDCAPLSPAEYDK